MIRINGHFGEFIQGILNDGTLGLISLPCNKYYVTLQKGMTGETNHVTDLNQIFGDIGERRIHSLEVNTNMVAGGGSGYSTALRMAIIKHTFGALSQDETLDKLLMCEKAIDPLFFPNFEHVLWCSRIAKIASDTPPLPLMEICGGFYGQPEFTSPEDMNFALIGDLVEQWKSATKIEEFAEISTESAKRTLHLRGSKNDLIFDLANEFNALGVVIAHTGSLRGLIFRPDETPNKLENNLSLRGFVEPVKFRVGGGI